ncbi:MAG TPA: hypothetical protein DEQ43_21975 [Nocardioides bacterium]|uniref:hypothetical protein n=1 Tax=uncultured Nocardioides sp. TaxID=198441 RepID=UPI000EEF814C|nr:hypothetical protein [uncultured Nocardioides sp.]HCB06876.1 hypothetical protein [Nocardioides sp.]HRD64301.1 hypothetical protein [Nocardioides sp.]
MNRRVNRRRRSARRAATVCLAVLTMGLAGCTAAGSDGEARAESSVDDFCSAVETFHTEVEAADSTDLAAYIRTLKAAAEKLHDVGVPDDMPAPAKQGFELTVERIQGLADDATRSDFTDLGDVGEEDQRKLDALEAYVDQACPDVAGK